METRAREHESDRASSGVAATGAPSETQPVSRRSLALRGARLSAMAAAERVGRASVAFGRSDSSGRVYAGIHLLDGSAREALAEDEAGVLTQLARVHSMSEEEQVRLRDQAAACKPWDAGCGLDEGHRCALGALWLRLVKLQPPKEKKDDPLYGWNRPIEVEANLRRPMEGLLALVAAAVPEDLDAVPGSNPFLGLPKSARELAFRLTECGRTELDKPLAEYILSDDSRLQIAGLFALDSCRRDVSQSLFDAIQRIAADLDQSGGLASVAAVQAGRVLRSVGPRASGELEPWLDCRGERELGSYQKRLDALTDELVTGRGTRSEVERGDLDNDGSPSPGGYRRWVDLGAIEGVRRGAARLVEKGDKAAVQALLEDLMHVLDTPAPREEGRRNRADLGAERLAALCALGALGPQAAWCGQRFGGRGWFEEITDKLLVFAAGGVKKLLPPFSGFGATDPVHKLNPMRVTSGDDDWAVGALSKPEQQAARDALARILTDPEVCLHARLGLGFRVLSGQVQGVDVQQDLLEPGGLLGALTKLKLQSDPYRIDPSVGIFHQALDRELAARSDAEPELRAFVVELENELEKWMEREAAQESSAFYKLMRCRHLAEIARAADVARDARDAQAEKYSKWLKDSGAQGGYGAAPRPPWFDEKLVTTTEEERYVAQLDGWGKEMGCDWRKNLESVIETLEAEVGARFAKERESLLKRGGGEDHADRLRKRLEGEAFQARLLADPERAPALIREQVISDGEGAAQGQAGWLALLDPRAAREVLNTLKGSLAKAAAEQLCTDLAALSAEDLEAAVDQVVTEAAGQMADDVMTLAGLAAHGNKLAGKSAELTTLLGNDIREFLDGVDAFKGKPFDEVLTRLAEGREGDFPSSLKAQHVAARWTEQGRFGSLCAAIALVSILKSKPPADDLKSRTEYVARVLSIVENTPAIARFTQVMLNASDTSGLGKVATKLKGLRALAILGPITDGLDAISGIMSAMEALENGDETMFYAHLVGVSASFLSLSAGLLMLACGTGPVGVGVVLAALAIQAGIYAYEKFWHEPAVEKERWTKLGVLSEK